MVYTRRKAADPGIWLATVRVSERRRLEIEANEKVWRPERTTQSGCDADFAEWQDFAFGEPSVTILPDGGVLVAFWCIQPHERGIRYLMLRVC